MARDSSTTTMVQLRPEICGPAQSPTASRDKSLTRLSVECVRRTWSSRIVNKIRLDHVLRTHSTDKRVSDLSRLAVGDCAGPQISGRSWTIVVVEESRAIATERRRPARRFVQSFGQRKSPRFPSREVIQVNVSVTVHIRGIGQVSSVSGKADAGDFPLVLREPANFLGGDVQQSGVLVSIGGVRCDQDVLTIG